MTDALCEANIIGKKLIYFITITNPYFNPLFPCNADRKQQQEASMRTLCTIIPFHYSTFQGST